MPFDSVNSVGLVHPEVAQFDEPLQLACGRTLSSYELVYETYGTLNDDRSNAVLICHALSGHHHAAGYHSEDDRKPGWWEQCIGPGKPIDTNRFFVVSLNNLGGCNGSTGPATALLLGVLPAPAGQCTRTPPSGRNGEMAMGVPVDAKTQGLSVDQNLAPLP